MDKVCAIVGAGPGNGKALAQRFAADGYRVALLARNEQRLAAFARELPGALPVACDVTKAESIAAAFSRISRELGQVETLVYNAGNYMRGGVESTALAQLEECLRINAIGCLAAAQQVVPDMRQRGAGAIIVIGATASRRGSAGVLPFAAAKAGQRVMVESMARELWPQGIHVSYVVIDAVIDSPFMRALFPCQAADAFARTEHIARSVAFLAAQPRSAWTFEVDLRPHVEKW